MKIKILLILWLSVIFGAISYLFWRNEYKYSLPTPVPVNYHAVNIGQHINLKGALGKSSDKPLFLHFFNPECPCSRFNIPHIESLVKKYGDKMAFAIVVIAKDSSYTEQEIQNRFDLTVPVLFDTSIADSCGIYSTPQAVILDMNHNLYYRGNYNRTRYCADDKSNFAQMAIDSLLNKTQNPIFDAVALKPYGCTLPNCEK
ncbi:TlpA family protein disulfide reductase [Flavobacterium terrisoli]|uniref:TlpA family protein disulfide reductase n=1 Tax=Flavobacterium terrisoli TaxID=3242195 RepID=UPI002542A292|nr:redoxin domain-containing protein [Flavobacterium buctense]